MTAGREQLSSLEQITCCCGAGRIVQSHFPRPYTPQVICYKRDAGVSARTVSAPGAISAATRESSAEAFPLCERMMRALEQSSTGTETRLDAPGKAASFFPIREEVCYSDCKVSDRGLIRCASRRYTARFF